VIDALRCATEMQEAMAGRTAGIVLDRGPPVTR